MTTIETARRHLRNFDSVLRRVEAGANQGRNSAATDDCVRGHFYNACRFVVEIEDREGVDAAAPLADKLTALRQRATQAGVLSPEDVFAAEDAAVQS